MSAAQSRTPSQREGQSTCSTRRTCWHPFSWEREHFLLLPQRNASTSGASHPSQPRKHLTFQDEERQSDIWEPANFLDNGCSLPPTPVQEHLASSCQRITPCASLGSWGGRRRGGHRPGGLPFPTPAPLLGWHGEPLPGRTQTSVSFAQFTR